MDTAFGTCTITRGAQQFFYFLFGISSQALTITNVLRDFVPIPKSYIGDHIIEDVAGDVN